METRQMKKISDSRTIQHYLVMPGDTNGSHVLFGGKLLSWIDELAGIVAMRHSNSQIVTVAIDHLEFKKSSFENDVITLDGRVTWVGSSSMEVRIDSWRENKDVDKELINTAYIVMVALEDDRSRTKQVPGILLETPEDVQEWEAGVKRDALRKHRKKENY